ncbi:MAG: Hsp33 family molecular chaperone HslO [Saccharofermentans sp.]|nr:Hsp33 family molecular chaperone HslO [Saccharofermentans sp.]
MSTTDNTYYAPGVPMDQKEDHIIRAMALKGHVKAVAINSTKAVAEALRIHNTSPVVTAALGRFITGSLLIAENMKNPTDTQTTIIRCDGPIRGMTCVCDSQGHAKAYAIETQVEATYHRPQKLNVGAAVGNGSLTVIRDIGLKEPYTGSVQLVSGEIAEDFTYYLASSEQTPSVVALGVQIGPDGVLNAGGFMVQLMPGATEEDIDYVEKRANGGFPDITFLMEEGFTPAKILDLFMGDPDMVYMDGYPISYKCNCSRDRMYSGLAALPRDDIKALSEDTKGIDTECHFCDQKYHFTPEEIGQLLSED